MSVSDPEYDLIHESGDGWNGRESKSKQWKIKDMTAFLHRNDRYKEALMAIKNTTVPINFPGGPEDMNPEARRYCAAFGSCIGKATEALQTDA